MKNHTRIFPRLASVLVLTLTLIFSFAYLTPETRLRAVSAQSMSPSGSFGFLVSASYSDPSNENGFAVLGVMNFDGAGSVTGSYTAENGDSATQTSQPITGTLTGTYSSNPDGSGSVAITVDVGISFTFAMAITDGGQGLQLVATQCSGGCNIGGTTTISGVARAAQTGSPNGSYGFQFTNSPTPGGSVGVASFDGAGNVSESFTFVGLTGTSGQPAVFSGKQTGTYSMNPDGSGTINLEAIPGLSGAQTYAFVITDGGSGALLLQTNRAGNGVSFGTGRLQ